METNFEIIQAKLAEHGVELDEAAIRDVITLVKETDVPVQKDLKEHLRTLDYLGDKMRKTDDWKMKAAYAARIFNEKHYPFLDT